MATRFLLLFLALFAFSASSEILVSIDCGSSSILYTDDNLIVWTGDADLFKEEDSETYVVQSSKTASTVMSSLRVFTSGRKKYCYSIPVDKGKQILVRASFFYGNYDKKSSPPTFDMHFDGNSWATVNPLVDQVVYYEVAYVPKGDSISVCLAQTHPNQLPFISALEVRGLDSGMYSHVDSEYALFLKSRVAYGATSIIRYSDDPYDRIWVPAGVGTGLTSVASNAIFIESNVPDNPPNAVLQNAITTSNGADTIILGTTFPTKPVPIYATMFFSEVEQLSTTEKRSFEIYIDHKSESDPILPPYGSVQEMYISNISASASSTFSLVATADSTLPPLINALELFFVSDPLTDGTNSKDVAGLGELQTEFRDLRNWVGDPCLPAPYSWDWIECSTGDTPRVTALYLSGFDLQGSLPDFSSMDALVKIDLHNNSITGPIPDFLGTLPNLKELNLAGNAFSGPIPVSISNNKKLKLVVSGNPDMCVSGKSCKPSTDIDSSTGSPSGSSSGSSSKKSSKLPVILGVAIPLFIVFWAIVGVLIILHHKRKTAAVNAAVTTGNGNWGNGRQGAQANNNGVMGKHGETMMNEIKVNIQENKPQDHHENNHGRDDHSDDNGDDSS